MECKKSIIILILTIFLLSITGVCASDVNDILVASEDTAIELSQSDEITTTDESQKTIQTNGAEILTVSDEETTAAQNNLDTLSFEEKTYADLSNDIGSGGDINLQPAYYKYNGESDTITITTPGIINGNGAIIDMAESTIRAFTVNTAGVTIKNLTIKNANYTDRGGAIFFSQSSTGTVENCNFANNTAANYGGAIFFSQSSTGTVDNCNFTNNTAFDHGGAIDFQGSGIVTNCNFIDNQATGEHGSGGAIYICSGNVTNCNFTKNNAASTGGAIYFYVYSNGSVTNCNFTKNAASNGGAIYFDIESSGEVINCNFTKNNAASTGGAIYFYFHTTGRAENCNFVNNSANSGGAIFSYQQSTVADTCIFKTNPNINTIILPPTLNDDNFTTFYGSGEKLTFDLKTNSGMPVYNGNISISVYYKDNDAWIGNYSCLSGEGWTVDLPVGFYYATFNTEYAEFKAINRTITIMPNNTFWALNHTINANDKAKIDLTNDYSYDHHYDADFADGVKINRKVTVNGNGYTINAQEKARVFDVQASDVTINNLTIENANYNGDGGAIYFHRTGTVTNCNFTNNTATSQGGAVYFWDLGTVTNCNFADNTATYGGAVYFLDTGNVTNCNFTNNSAKYGGAIRFNGEGTVTNCNFTVNTAGFSSGGAVYFSGTGNVTNCNFIGNKVTGDGIGGGAIYFWNQGTLSNCNFTDNQATSYGGAVCFNENGDVSNCIFNNNKVPSGRGGAIYFNQGNSAVADCVFINNSAGNFSAVHLSSGVGNVSGCLFINNTAEFGVVGQAWDSYGQMNVNNNIFLNNDVTTDVIDFADFGNMNTDYNWFGNTQDNYIGGVPSQTSNVWLFMNATANPNPVPVTGSSKIVFKLYAYNTSGNISNYNNNLLKPVNLTITKANGEVDKGIVNLDDAIVFNPESTGTGSVTASVENIVYTIKFNIKANPEMSLDPQDVYYSNNTVISLNYNSTATGKVNITLKGKKFDYTFTDMALNDTVSLGKVNPDEYNVTVTYSGDDSFLNATAKGNLTVTPIVDVSITITTDKDEYFVGDVVVWTLTVHNAGNGTNATDVYVDNNFPGDYFEMFNAITDNGTYYKNIGNEYWWEIGFMANGTDATLKVFSQAKAARGDIPNFANAFAKEDDWNYTNNLAQKDVTVKKINSILNVTDTVLDYGQAANITVTTEGATGIAANIITQKGDVIEADVMGFTIMIPVLDAGNYTLSVTTKADANHNPVTKTANIAVNKAHTEIILANETINLKAGDKINDVAKLTPADAGNLTFQSSNEDIALAYEGTIWARIKGNVTVTVSFEGNDNYAAAENKTITVYITPKDASVSVENETRDLNVDDKYEFNPTVNPSFLAVQYSSSNESVATVTDYGLLRAVGEGTAIITLTVGNDQTYAINTTNVTVKVSKIPTEINLTNATVDLKVLDEISSGATLTPADAGNLTYASGNESVVIVKDGKIIAVGAGKAVITVSFAGDDKYAPAEDKTVTVTVSLKDATVTVNNSTLNLFVDDTFTVVATTSPDGLNVTFVPDNSGVVSINNKGVVTALKEGIGNILVKVGGDGVYIENSTTVNVTVSKVPTEIESSAVSTVYNGGKNLIVTLKDAYGKPISDVNITVDLNGAKTYTTDNNGQIKVSTKGLEPKTYTAKITFNGNDKYDQSAKDVKVTVKKAKPKITAKNKTYKKSVKTKKYSITLKDNTGKPIKKAKVTLKVKGKTYNATTNSKGKATFKIKKLNKKGTFNAVIKYKGNKYYNKVTKKSKIKVIVTFKTVSKGSKDKSTVKDIQQALKDHGYYLTYKGHYLKIDGNYKGFTERSVKEFQHDKGLKVTGKVDEKTAHKLGII